MGTRTIRAAILLAALSGCDAQVPFETWRVCSTEAQCDPGFSCIGGRCQKCPQCGEGERCLLGQCLPTNCDGTECLAGEVCLEGRCVGARCLDLECPDGRCISGSCWPVRCGTTECAAGQVCDDGTCRQAACAGIDCAEGSRCQGGVCLTCGTLESCSGGADEDCDGAVDCADLDCESQVCGEGQACSEMACSSGSCVERPRAAGSVCRAAAGICDREESCDGASFGCPAEDELLPAGTACRPAAGDCDVAEYCDGAGVDCPDDAVRPESDTCRPAAGDCDVAELCDGTGTNCPADQLKTSGICDGSTGPCELDAQCDGSGAACPAKQLKASGLCDASAGPCELDAQCDGSGVACPAKLLKTSGLCDASTGPCELDAQCDGSGAACPAKALRSGTVCRISAGLCDAAELCDGVNAGCPSDLLRSGILCRDATDLCDAAESCDGVGVDCPEDLLAPEGTSCGSGCFCSGTSAVCPDAPQAPTFVATDPSSPTNASTSPLVIGLASADTVTVTLYSDGGCTLSIGSGTKSAFESTGIAALVAAEATTTIYAVAFNASSVASACTLMTTFLHDSLGPDAPAFGRTDPSPPTGPQFRVVGTASADTVTVTIFTDAACSDSVGSDAKANFEGGGVAVTLPSNADAALYGQAVDSLGNPSHCVALTNYTAVRAWTWVSGNNGLLVSVPGTKGVPAAANHPGSRQVHTVWARDGKVWVFGGEGCTSKNCGTMENLSDLWRFDGSNWTWMTGGTLGGEVGAYGVMGTPDPANSPGARQLSLEAIDAAGNLWLFGGYGLATSKTLGELNDLWKFDGTNWTWVSGNDAINTVGVYGTRGVAAAGNTPGSRDRGTMWFDSDGRLWIHGGTGCDSVSCVTDNSKLLQDVWMFDGTNWTWMAGPDTANVQASYGALGASALTNLPGGRHLEGSWYTAARGLEVFGGYGFDAANGTKADLNDLWRFAAGAWTWVGGSSTANQLAVPGTPGVAALTNWPGARDGFASAVDGAGNAWVYGGNGCDSATCNSTNNFLSDLWRWDGTHWTWISGSSLANELPSYGAMGVPAVTNRPGGRYTDAAFDSNTGALWIFGGRGMDLSGQPTRLADLWRYQ